MSVYGNRHVIYIPGLGNSLLGYKFFKWRWRHKNWTPHLVKMDWLDDGDFPSKLTRLLNAVDEITAQGHKVALVGSSAGGTMALNALAQRPDKITAVAAVCSPVTLGDGTHPLLRRTDRGIPLAKQALIELEKNRTALTPELRKRIMTFTPLYDEWVPPESTILAGAVSKKLWSAGHFFNLLTVQLFYAGEMESFFESAII